MKFIKKKWPLFFIFAVWISLFFPFFKKGLLPIPADIIAGVYYPWLDYKWGYSVGVPVKNPLISDIPSILYPWRSVVIDQLKSFQWPLWNPYYFTGMPLLANFQSAVFSYVNIFFLFFSKPIAWSLGVVTSPILTMLLMYSFLRNRKLNQIPSVLGSIVFSLSGFEIAWMEYNVHGHTALFLPLFLLVIDKYLRDGNIKFLFILPVTVAFQIFAGYIPVVIYSGIICFFYTMFVYFIPELLSKKIKILKYVLLIIFAFWGILLSSIQLLPGVELTKLSVRLIDPIVLASNASYLPIKNLITAVAPDFFGNPATGNYFGTAFYDNFYFFAGIGTLILVLYSCFFVKKHKDILFWLFILLFSFLLAIKNPIGQFLEKILFLSGGVASKSLFITDFSLAILASLGLNEIVRNGIEKKWKLIIPLFIFFMFFMFLVKFSFKISDLTNRLVAQRNLIIPFGFFVFSAVVLAAFLIKKVNRNILGMLLVILTSLNLLYSAKKYLPFSKEELLFPKTPVIEFLQQKAKQSTEPFRVELGEVIPQNFLMPYGIETSSGYDALLPKRTAQFFSLVETGRVQEKLSRVWLLRNYDSEIFPLLNTKYILAKKVNEKGYFSPEGKPPPIFSLPRFKLVFEDKTVQVYEDTKFLPRAFWSYTYLENQIDGDFISLIKSQKNIKEKIYLEDDMLRPLGAPMSGGSGKITYKTNTANEIILEVESNQPGYVFISKTNFPGWKAFINDKETFIYRTNIAFDSVFVPAGRNLLTLSYRPKSFLIGKSITFFAMINWFLVVFFLILRTKYINRKLILDNK